MNNRKPCKAVVFFTHEKTNLLARRQHAETSLLLLDSTGEKNVKFGLRVGARGNVMLFPVEHISVLQEFMAEATADLGLSY